MANSISQHLPPPACRIQRHHLILNCQRMLVHEGTREVVTKAADAGEGEGWAEEDDDAGDEPAKS